MPSRASVESYNHVSWILADAGRPADGIVDVIGSIRDSHRLATLTEKYGDRFHSSNAAVATAADVLALAVKPTQVRGVCEELRPLLSPEQCAVETTAAVPLAKLREWLPETKLLARCMPNTPCSVNSGVIAWAEENDSDPEAARLIEDLLAPNKTVEVAGPDKGSGLDGATVISGCGPAFVAWFSALVGSAGHGMLTDETRQALVTGTLSGVAAFLEKETPQSVIRAVASPKGATEKALERLAASKVADKITLAFCEARQRLADLRASL